MRVVDVKQNVPIFLKDESLGNMQRRLGYYGLLRWHALFRNIIADVFREELDVDMNLFSYWRHENG